MREKLTMWWVLARASEPARIVHHLTRGRRAEALERLAQMSVESEWLELLDRRFEFHAALDADERRLFRRQLNVVMRGTRWIGADGFEVDSTAKLLVAGRAAQMSMHLPVSVWSGLHTVVFFPNLVPSVFAGDEASGLALGHSLLLGFDAVEHGAQDQSDGWDVVLHELAHILDYADLDYDGVPALHPYLHPTLDRDQFCRTVGDHYRAFSAGELEGVSSYAATSRAELFAVATELFFENPRLLRVSHPRLYALLRTYYRTG